MDGGLAIAGYTTSEGNGAKDILLIRLDANGELLWQKTFGGELQDVGKSIVAMPDGGFFNRRWYQSWAIKNGAMMPL